MPSIEIDQNALSNTVRDAIALKVASELTPEAFVNFVNSILQSRDGYRTTTIIESAAIDAIKTHLQPIVEEWVEQNSETLKKQVFEHLEGELGPALGEKVVAHITSVFNIERKR